MYKQPNNVLVPNITNLQDSWFEYSDFFWDIKGVTYNWVSNQCSVTVGLYRFNPNNEIDRTFIFDCVNEWSITTVYDNLLATQTFIGSIIV